MALMMIISALIINNYLFFLPKALESEKQFLEKNTNKEIIKLGKKCKNIFAYINISSKLQFDKNINNDLIKIAKYNSIIPFWIIDSIRGKKYEYTKSI